MSSVYNTSNIIHCPLYRQVGLIRCVCFVKKTWPVKRNTCSERLKLLLKQVVKFSDQGKTYSFLLKISKKNILKLKNIRENPRKMVLKKCCELCTVFPLISAPGTY